MIFNENNIVDFWERIKLLCKENNKTQSELCNELNIPIQNLRNKKTRNVYPSIEEIYNISQNLKVSIEYLLTGVESDEYKNKYETLITDLQNLINV